MTDTNTNTNTNTNSTPNDPVDVRANPTDSIDHRQANVLNLADLAPERPGVLASARRAGNPVLSGPLQDTDTIRVKLPSGVVTTMTLRQASFAGIVKKDEKEGYVLADTQPKSDAKRAEDSKGTEAPTDDVPEIAINPEVKQVETKFFQTLRGQGHSDTAFIAELLATGEIPKSLEDIARKAGVPMEQAVKDVQRIVREYNIQAEAAVIAAGVPVDELDGFWDYIERIVPKSKMNSAFMRHACVGDLRAYMEWARTYLKNAPRGSSERVVKTVVNGKTITTTEGNARRFGATIV